MHLTGSAIGLGGPIDTSIWGAKSLAHMNRSVIKDNENRGKEGLNHLKSQQFLILCFSLSLAYGFQLHANLVNTSNFVISSSTG